MGDPEGPWSRSVTSIARRRGAGLRSPQEGEPTSKFVAEGAARVAAPVQTWFKIFLAEICICISVHNLVLNTVCMLE